MYVYIQLLFWYFSGGNSKLHASQHIGADIFIFCFNSEFTAGFVNLSARKQTLHLVICY